MANEQNKYAGISTLQTFLSQLKNLFITKTDANAALSGKADASHNHDDDYYTEIEIDEKFDGVAYLDEYDEHVATAPLNADTLGGHPASDFATKSEVEALTYEDVNAVPTTRTVNGKVLSSNITLSAGDVGARPDTWMPTAEEVGALSKYGGDITGQLKISNTHENGYLHIFKNNSWEADYGVIFQDRTKDGRFAELGMSVNGDYLMATLDSGATWKDIMRATYNRYWATWVNDVHDTHTSDGYEWFFPPMLDGYIYRTCERYDGKPVYTMKFSAGEVANGVAADYPGINDNTVSIIRSACQVGNITIPQRPAGEVDTSNANYASYYIAHNGFYFHGGSNFAGSNVKMQLWFVYR